MAVEMKVANQRDINAHPVQLIANIGHCLRCLWRVYRYADHFRTSKGQFFDLNGGSNGISRICVGHRLQTHRRVRAPNRHDT